MMRALVLLSSLALAVLVAPASAGPTEAFSRVDAEGRFKVEVAAGERHAVEIAGRDAGRVEVRVRNGELQLRQAGITIFGPPKLDAVVHVTAPALSAISAARGAQVEGVAAGGDLSLTASQGGMVDVQAGARERLEATASMGGILEVSGSCGTLQAHASMGGIIDAEALGCADVRAEASMGGVIEAQATDAADGSASMGGSVEIAGAPGKRTSRASMGGDVSFH